MDYGFAQISGPAQWRFPIGFQMVFMAVLIPLVLILPESPRWLHEQGRHEEANNVIARLVGKDVALDDARVLELAKEINDAIELEHADGPFEYKELFAGGKLQNFRRMVLCFCVDAFQQLGG
jgi:Sugar (and other) transporter